LWRQGAWLDAGSLGGLDDGRFMSAYGFGGAELLPAEKQFVEFVKR
jgi:hypothetical protein